MRKFYFIILLVIAVSSSLKAQLYLDSTASVDDRLNDLIQRMTLQEKIGQMIQVDRQYVASNKEDITNYAIGSLLSGGGSGPSQNNAVAWADMYDDFQSYALSTRLKIPLIYGIDAVHGHNNVYGATIFPHNIGMGCTKNEYLVRTADSVAAVEVAATGIDWTFAPCIAVPRNERWGRTYEGFGETPELTEIMARASVQGFQGNDISAYNKILACAKHFIADGGTQDGRNEGNAVMTEEELRRIHLPGYIEALKAGVGSIMPSYSSWNGVKMHGNKYLLTDVLKTELGFTGFVISDYAGIDQLPGNYREDIKQSINAGVDMVMIPDRYVEFAELLEELVLGGDVSIERIDDAVRRILRKKFELGLFEKPFADRDMLAAFGSAAHREVARQCVRESLVLLRKKDGILPLNKTGQKILVAGKGGNDIGMQCGGWTISWQGRSGDITPGTTVYEAVRNIVGNSNTVYDRYGDNTAGFNTAVIVIGEYPYAEGSGDRNNLELDSEDLQTVRKIKEAGLKTIVVLFSGRPMILKDIIPYSDVLIAAWLPGTEGEGITDLLFGDFEPKGKLQHSWPRDMSQIPINFGDANYDPLFPLDYGISSLEDSPRGSSPEYFSSSTSEDGSQVIVSFNKSMSEPETFKSGFNFYADGNLVNIILAAIDVPDSASIVFTLENIIQPEQAVTLIYNQNGYTSADGGVLNSFGPVEVYNLRGESNLMEIPGQIEAENYSSMFGVQTENTSDTGGGLNVGWIDDGDWIEYNVNIKSTGIYTLILRVAALSTAGIFRLRDGDQILAVLNLPVTNGWQNWQSVNAIVDLQSGSKALRFEALRGGFNLNWFSFDIVTDVKYEIKPDEFFLSQNYPNPFNPETTIQYQIPFRELVTLKVFDVLGREIKTLVSEIKSPGIYNVVFNGTGLPSGIYFYKLITGEFSQTKKFLLLK